MPSTIISRIDGLTTSVAVKAPIRIMTSSPITLSGEQTINAVTPDGTPVQATVLDGDRVGVNGQADQKTNGIYVCRTTAWERAKDFDGSLDAVLGTLVTDSIPLIWRLITPYPVLFGTSNIVFETEDGFNQGNLTRLADAVDILYGATMVGYKGRTVRKKIDERISTADSPGNTVSDGTDQTAGVQATLNALPATGGIVFVPPGTKFNIKSLTFPEKSNLTYYAGDDTSVAGPGSEIGTNELVSFSANSSGGIVNEWRQTAAFHPGMILDVRSDIPGHDAWLGGGQSRIDPVRASYNLHQQQTDRYRILYEKYDDYSQFSGATQHGWRAVLTLNGIGTADWISLPSVDNSVRGATSGAKGYLISVAAGATVLLWSSGKFVVGEALVHNLETTTATITSIGYTLSPFQPIGQDIKRGNWSIGLPVGSVRDLFAVGGKMTVAKTRSFSQYIDETIANPAYCLIDSYEGTTSGFELTYDTTPAVAQRRVTLRKYDQTADIGLIGATRAATGFSNSVLKADSSFNVSGIVRNGVGDYTITFITPFVTADYMVAYGASAPTDYAYTFVKSVGSLRVKVVLTGSTTAQDLTGVLDVVCSCGDI